MNTTTLSLMKSVLKDTIAMVSAIVLLCVVSCSVWCQHGTVGRHVERLEQFIEVDCVCCQGTVGTQP